MYRWTHNYKTAGTLPMIYLNMLSRACLAINLMACCLLYIIRNIFEKTSNGGIKNNFQIVLIIRDELGKYYGRYCFAVYLLVCAMFLLFLFHGMDSKRLIRIGWIAAVHGLVYNFCLYAI